MDIVKELVIPYRHKLHYIVEEYSIEEAFLVANNNYMKYLSAEKCSKDSEKMILTTAKIECALCSTQLPLPAYYDCKVFEDNFKIVESEELLSDAFYHWVFQTNLFDMLGEGNKYILTETHFENTFKCSNCEFETTLIEKGSTTLKFTITGSKKETTVSQHIEYEDVYMMSSPGSPPSLYPTLVCLEFNHDAGKTYFVDASYKVRDITEDNPPLEGFMLKKFLEEFVELKEAIISVFPDIHDEILLHRNDKKFLETLISANRFKGFPHSFYNAIPFYKNSRVIHCGFDYIVNNLKRYDDIPEIYKQNNLPDKKAMRKLIFNNPELIFYSKEIAELSSFFNYDVLLTILQSSKIVYLFLSNLHAKPELFIFLRQMVDDVGSVCAWWYIKHGIDRFIDAAKDYLRVNEGRPELYTFKRWKNTLKGLNESPSVEFNVFVSGDKNIPDDKIDDYIFTRLKNSTDYEKAAKHLNNCLHDTWWKSDDSVIIGIIDNNDNKYVGAIELNGKIINQAVLHGNEHISDDNDIFYAYLTWQEKHDLEVHCDD